MKTNRLPKWVRAAAHKISGLPSELSFTAPIEIIAAAAPADGQPKAPPTFNITAYTGGALRVGGFFWPVVLDLTGIRAAKTVKTLREHDPARIVGHATEVEITAKRIKVAGVISGTGEDAREVVANAGNGFPWEASVGVPIEKLEFVEARVKATVNGQNFQGPIYIVRAGELKEVSFVAFGADSNSSTSIAANEPTSGDQDMNFEQWLLAKGIETFNTLPASVQTQLKAQFDAEQKAPPTPAPAPAPAAVTAAAQSVDTAKLVADAATAAVEAASKKWEADQAQRFQLTKITAKHPELQIKALEEKWSVEKAELEVLRANSPQIGTLYANTGKGKGDISPQRVIEAAMCMAGGLKDVEKQFDAKTLEAAHSEFRGQIGLQRILLEAAWQGGYSGAHFDASASGLKEILQAAFSTMSLPGILSNVANKFLLQGFMAVEQAWREISAIRSTRDFKQVTSYRLTGNMEFEEVGADGELKHKMLGEEEFTNQARTFGIMNAITRKDLKNDDLGALTALQARIGRGGALKLCRVFWAAFMDNASFFASGNNNYQEGATTNLSIDSLTALELLFLNQTDGDAAAPAPLGIEPKILLLPNAIATLGAKLFKDTDIRDTTASTKYSTGNPHVGKFRPVRSSYLSNSGISGYSTKAFYLLADPNDLPAIETVFVDGVQQPTVEVAEADFNVLGIQLRGYWDFGVSKQDYRAGAKSKGEA